LLVPAGCGKRRHHEAAEEPTTSAPVAVKTPAPAPTPEATKREPGPNVGLSGIGRFWTEQEVKNNLYNLGRAYKNYVAEFGKGPPDQKTLSPYYERSPQIDEALSKGWFVFAWKSDPRRMQQGTSHTIIAYEPDADSLGFRWVLMADASVHKMSQPEFDNTPKAGK
jgi:hypothetical protein